MPQVSLSVSAETASRLRAESEARGCSISSVLAELVERHYGLAWPPGYLDGIRSRARALRADFDLARLSSFGERPAPDLSSLDE